jgi:hypothetical protein
MPSARSATVWLKSLVTFNQLCVVICVGTVTLIGAGPPLPNALLKLEPHVNNLLSDLIAAQWAFPAVTASQLPAQPSPELIIVGVKRFVVVPSPTWPDVLLPHANNLPSARIATVC